MGLKQLVLVLDPQGGTYRPGDVVTGRLIVAVDEEKKVNEIYVKLKGTAEVSWTETTTRRNGQGKTETVRRTYRASETHVDQHLTLLGGGAQRELVLPPGEHAYPFRATLPARIPPSFEGPHGYGHVRYRVKGKVDRPWRVNDVVETGVRVLGDVDLGLLPALREPARRVTEKTLCCCWCRSGPLSLVVQLPCTGLVPGQDLAVTAEVDNATTTRVDRVVGKLSQKVEFRAQGKVKSIHTNMSKVEFGSVDPGRSATWTRPLTLPQELTPSGLPHCNIIGVSYCLEVKAKVSGPHISPAVEIPVVVGNLPFRDLDLAPPFPVVTVAPPFPVVPMAPPFPVVPMAPPFPVVAVAEPSAPPLHFPPPPTEVPPPSYEESVYGIGFQPPAQSEKSHFP